jgi:hypothetical protein
MRLKTKKILSCIILSLAIIFIYNNLNYFQSKLIYKNFELKETYYSIFKSNFQFDIEKNVLVFVHIQKTGGSDFDRNIVRHLLVHDKRKNDWNRACEFILNKTIGRNIQIINEDQNNKLNNKKINKTKKKIKFKKFACKRNEIIENNDPNW